MTNQTFKLISVNLAGSRLYGLDSKNSDYDYTVLYKREPEDYICFGEYKNFMDETTLIGSRETNYKYWDIKKFLQLAGKSSFGALELLYCTEAYFNNPVYQYVLSEVRKENFNLRELMYHSRGIINGKHHRGYMKAFHFTFIQYLLQHKKLPDTLNADTMLNAVEMIDHLKTHIKRIFQAKRNGVKDMPFIVENYSDDDFKNLPKMRYIDYTRVLHRCIFDF